MTEAVRAQWPQAQVDCVDVLDYTPRWFRRVYSWSYLFLVQRAPWVWFVTYNLMDRQAVFQCLRALRRWWNLLIAARFVRWLKAEPPQAVVVAHFLPADVCSAGKRAGWLRAPVIVVVTDWHPHRFWMAPEADAIVVATEEGAAVCRARGLPAERLHVIGIPISGTAHGVYDRHALEQHFQLQPGRRTVLVTSGGTTVGPFEQVVAALMDLEHDWPGRMQLLVICGENDAAVRALKQRAEHAAMPVTILGFIENMAEAMAAAEVIVTKAGGMTLAEALAQGRPLVLYHAIPGQERFNARYVVRRGAAVMAHRPREVAQAVRRCLEDPAHLEALGNAAKALSRPRAAERVVLQAVRPLLADAPSR